MCHPEIMIRNRNLLTFCNRDQVAMQYIIIIWLLLGWLAPAKADTDPQQCQRWCGADEECIKQCISEQSTSHTHHHHLEHKYIPDASLPPTQVPGAEPTPAGRPSSVEESGYS